MTIKSKADLEVAWARYAAERSDDARNALMEFYLHLVQFQADRVHLRLPGEVQVDDLMQAGVFGLVDAIEAFDPRRGVKFETYSAPRIRGAILDELRYMDWVPRLTRARQTRVGNAREQLRLRNGQEPTDEQMMDELKVDPREYRKVARDSRTTVVSSLSRKRYETDTTGREVRTVDTLRDLKCPNPEDRVVGGDLQAALTKGLSRSERAIIVLYYWQGLTMREIGLNLGLSESRVSQMHSAILARLKSVHGGELRALLGHQTDGSKSRGFRLRQSNETDDANDEGGRREDGK